MAHGPTSGDFRNGPPDAAIHLDLGGVVEQQ
jgi:hypothetical protein